MEAEKLTIASNGQGQFVCTSGDEASEPGDSQTLGSVEDVVAWVQQELSEDGAGKDPGQAMWNQEAAKRAAPMQQQGM